MFIVPANNNESSLYVYKVVDIWKETLIEAYAALSFLQVLQTSRELGKSRET